MSKNSEQNRALAAALRNAGVKDVRPVWEQAKAMVAEGKSLAQVAKALGTPKAPGKVSEPTAAYSLTLPRTESRKAAPKAKPQAKAAKPQVAKFIGQPKWTGTVTLSREGEVAMNATIRIWAPRKKATGAGETHDVVITRGGAELTRCTMSPNALSRLYEQGTRVWVNEQAYVCTLAK